MKVSQKTIDQVLAVLEKAEHGGLIRMTPQEMGRFMAEASAARIEVQLDLKYQSLVKDSE